MKKILAILLTAILVLSVASAAFAAGQTVYVTSENAKVYHESSCPAT